MYEFVIDQDGVLTAITRGFWTVEIARAYREALLGHLHELRAKHGLALLLVDGRESAVQPTEVVEFLSNFEAEFLLGEHDRSAYIVPSSLAKLQAKRVIKGERAQCFLSEHAAKTWLLAGRAERAAANG